MYKVHACAVQSGQGNVKLDGQAVLKVGWKKQKKKEFGSGVALY